MLGLPLGHRSGPFAQLDTGATRIALYERQAMAATLGMVTPPADRPWGQRTAYVRDPDGHLVELVTQRPR